MFTHFPSCRKKIYNREVGYHRQYNSNTDCACLTHNTSTAIIIQQFWASIHLRDLITTKIINPLLKWIWHVHCTCTCIWPFLNYNMCAQWEKSFAVQRCMKTMAQCKWHVQCFVSALFQDFSFALFLQRILTENKL